MVKKDMAVILDARILEYYSSCGWAPAKQKADNVGACGPFTTRNDHGECVGECVGGECVGECVDECVVEASSASIHLGTLVTHEYYCKSQPEKPECTGGGFKSRISEYKGLAACEDSFLTNECAESFAVHLRQKYSDAIRHTSAKKSKVSG